jgi:hypothetical protein
MSDLQYGLALLGAVLIAGIFIVNRIQEFRHRKLAERLLPGGERDPLMAGAEAPERQEPGLAELEAETVRSSEGAEERLAALSPSVLPETEPLNPTLEYGVTFTASAPVSCSALWASLNGRNPARVRWAGLDTQGGRWLAIEGPARNSFSTLVAMLPLSSRLGPVTAEQLALFKDEMHNVADALGVEMQAGDVPAALLAAEVLDRFCARVDVLFGMNVAFPEQAPQTAHAIRVCAEAQGMTLGQDGSFHVSNGGVGARFTMASRDSRPFLDIETDTSLVSGITFLLDVPNISDGTATLRQMFEMAGRFASTLGGAVVDDNDVPLGERQLALIEKQLTNIHNEMLRHGVPAGSALAQRLFSR